MKVAILAPYRSGPEDRARLWDFAKTRWQNDHPDWPITEAPGPVAGPFNRAAAINEAAEKAGKWDVALIVDTDTLCDPDAARTAVKLATTTAAIVVAGDERIMLSKTGTRKVLGGYRGSWSVGEMVERVYAGGKECSAVVAVSRKLWDQVGGFDPLFVGWGFEDVAFRIACETLSGQHMVKLSSELFHLWHTTSHENNARTETYKANEARCDRYRAARWNPDALRVLIDEARTALVEPVELGPTVIPRILHRTVPAETSDQVEQWWTELKALHPGWEFRTHRDPLDPADWPLTGDLWGRCANGAQKAGLIRLEALVTHGGVYVDSDCEPHRSLEPLLHVPAFAAWEDRQCVPDAVMGATAHHPAFEVMLEKARAVIQGGGDAWHSGPGVSTETLPGRPDVLLLPPGAFYPRHYLDKQAKTSADGPWVFLRHDWAGSWLSPEQKRSIERRTRR